MSEPVRPTPEQILARIKEEESSEQRGHLKIFLGAAAGVGKTYTMLGDARKLINDNVDVVGGVVVTHGRQDTEALVEGLELLAPKILDYKNTRLEEFDLDGALQRRPEVILVDELAHTNAPGSRHEKRWQDVEELLQSGINVLATVNIQHLESVNDLIVQITGIKVHETVPDTFFEKADVIELVDLPPDELIERLHEGKVYIPETAKIALQNFFKRGNLIALRELALRVTAERVDAEMRKYREDTAVQDVWPVTERILVCVGPSPLSMRLVRATRRMAMNLRAQWIAAYVETSRSAKLSKTDRDRVAQTLRFAGQLGAQTVRLSGTIAAEELVKYAQKLNVSHIVVGKPARPRWREILFGSLVDDLIRRSGNIDVYVITGEQHKADAASSVYNRAEISWKNYCYSVLTIAAATVLSRLLFNYLEPVNLVMIYLLAIVLVALRWGKGPSTLASLLGVAAFDFFFVPPYLTFAVSDTQYVLTFIVMLAVGLALSTMTSTIKQQAELARHREHQTAALYRMTREQAQAMSTGEVVEISSRHLASASDGQVVLLLAGEDKKLQVINKEHNFELDAKELGVAQWVFINDQPAGATTSTLAGARALYMPLKGALGVIGVIGVVSRSFERFTDPDELHLLETFVVQTALAVERAQLSDRRN